MTWCVIHREDYYVNEKHLVQILLHQKLLKKYDFYDILLEFSNRLLNDNIIPEQWSEINMLPLPKTGDLSQISNYRGIN